MFKVIQDSQKKKKEAEVKRHLLHPHWTTFAKRSCRDMNFKVSAFSFFILHGEFVGKNMVWSI